ncbi:MAG: STAS domain-containing protein [Bacillota bacterium]
MEIQEQQQGAVTVLKPMGPLIQADAEQFHGSVLQTIDKSLGRVVIDASGIAFVDSQGLEALVDLTEHLSESGRVLKLCTANETLREVLGLTGWSDAFEYFEDVNSGVRSFL